MLFDELGESARLLIRNRAKAFGEELTRLAREYSNATSAELTEALNHAPREQKAKLGLLLARVALEDAMESRSRELLGRFLFRFGAHLKASVSVPGLAPAQRLCLAVSAEEVFDALPNPNSSQRAEVAAIRARLAGPKVTDNDWKKTVGVTAAEFTSLMEQFARELGERRVSTAERVRPHVRASREMDKSMPTHPLPGWLSIAFSTTPDPLVAATANWKPAEIRAASPASIARAWSAFREGEYLVARSEVDELLAKIDDKWGPTSGADAIRSWNWLRLVVELAAIESQESPDVRRSSTSACVFLNKCLPDDVELLELLLERAIGDFVASDLASSRALSAYTTRLVADLGHEAALASYANRDKAALRSLWSERYHLDASDGRSTVTAASAVVSRFKQSTQKLYLAARDGGTPARALREASHEFVEFLDEAEGVLFSECLELAQDAERLVRAEGTNHRDLRELKDALGAAGAAVAASGSDVLQDFLAPLVELTIAEARRAATRLGDISRPEVAAQLSTSKVPFSAAAGSPIRIPFIVTNSGNATAESITLRVVEEQLAIDTTARLDALGPGAQAEIVVTTIATGSSPRAVQLTCHLQWTDPLLQSFGGTQQLPAEDQMPVAWTDSDVNPFSLGTISEPERLVGRAADLASLDALIAGKASAYITGHKRVGKTSLTRVLLRSIRETRGWAGSLLPLGRALGQDQSAGDLVYALLDEILDAAQAVYDSCLDELGEVHVDESGNFARAANRWLRAAARALPSDARVIVAIDDFDELPQHLISGPQADALFLFLRSLVDEPWLNLIVVGSEILPSIIQAQAHKLNQVVPVSVTNFPSRASTAELLETPTADRLEWLSDAIDRVHYLCAGNPYYETLLAQRLWQTMRERSRSVVTSSDIDDAANSVAREASDSHFIHLWADGSKGLDHTARSAIVASAIIRSVARCGGETLAPAASEEVTRVAQSWIQTATTDELNQAIAALAARDVLRPGPSANSLLIGIPLVGIWLLAAGGRALDGVYATSKHATATVRMITDSDLVALARQLRYRGEHVTEIRIRAWLEQFGDHYRQYLAFKMLRRMVFDGYFTSTRLQNIELPRLAAAVNELGAARQFVREANNQALRNAFLIDHGVPGDSTQGTTSALAKALRVKKANIIKPSLIPERLRGQNSAVLFLLDDYAGTGTHLRGEMASILEIIGEMGEDWAERINVVVGASVVSDVDDLPASDGPVTIEAAWGTYLGDRFRPFNPESGVFDTAKEREDAEDITSSIGRALMPNNPLGYGGRALLTLFEFNCPNNVAPIFWRSGTVSGQPWIPLFERAT
ncbi:phosphoribosyltransferase-like protein [Leifsonia sp. McL0607]|uniref:ATP-binding protein n=1 Tax=Leifsonia sp. McL0607 TaxID=3415672 RepID=UPI003CF18D1C